MSYSDGGPITVLFVCLGNICRSPMAEAVFAKKVADAGLSDRISADSAGTGDWHVGEPAHAGTRRMLAEKGIPYAGRARHFTRADLARFDYILTMDDDNLAAVRALGPARGVVRGLLDYSSDRSFTEVPDPYYTGGFGGVYGLIDGACDGLLVAIRRDQNL